MPDSCSVVPPPMRESPRGIAVFPLNICIRKGSVMRKLILSCLTFAGACSLGIPCVQADSPVSPREDGISFQRRLPSGGSGYGRGRDGGDAPSIYWASKSSQLLTGIQNQERALLIWFADADDESEKFDSEFAKAYEHLSYMRVDKAESDDDEESSDEADEDEVISPVPVNKLSADDLWSAYEVDDAGTYLLTDWYGNVVETYSSKPSKGVIALAKALGEKREKAIEGMVKDLEDAQEEFDEGNTKRALKSLFKVFDEELAGFEPTEDAATLYAKIIEQGQAELDRYKAASDESSLKEMARTFRKTELESSIDAALDELKKKDD